MTTRLLRAICTLAMLVTVLASAASAYPSRSNITSRYNCIHKSGQSGMGFKINYDNTYRHDADAQDGEYRYNRDTGRVNFKTGALNRYFLKVSRGDNGWKYRLREKNDGSLWGSCSQTGG